MKTYAIIDQFDEIHRVLFDVPDLQTARRIATTFWPANYLAVPVEVTIIEEFE